jgi:hypothetical protein
MFCCLYLLFDRAAIAGYEKEICFPECKHFKNGSCSILKMKDEPLSKNKFDWMIHMVIIFPEPLLSKAGNTKYLSAIFLVHPSSSDVVIVKSKRITKKREDDIYRVNIGGGMQEFDSLDILDRYLRMKGYDARKIKESDFN